MEERKNLMIIEVNNANNLVSFWERNKDDSGITLQFIDSNKVEIYLLDEYEDTIEDAEELVKYVEFAARL